jgi:exodeoxyribonuclease VII small subunit
MANTKKDITFEHALERLNQIVDQLEAESVTLDQSLELFSEGKRLAEVCQTQLAAAEERVQTLIKTSTGFEEKPGLEGKETRGQS